MGLWAICQEHSRFIWRSSCSVAQPLFCSGHANKVSALLGAHDFASILGVSTFRSCIICVYLYTFLSIKYVSKSREKSYGKTHTHKTAPHSSKSPLLSVIGVPVCATLACWQVSSMFQSKSEWSLQMDQIPAVPTGLAVGTNPPSLPTGG